MQPSPAHSMMPTSAERSWFSFGSATKEEQNRARGGRDGRLTLNTDVDVILLITSFDLSTVVIGLRERIEGLEILDVRGHEIDWERSAGAATGVGWCWVEVWWSGEWTGEQSKLKSAAVTVINRSLGDAVARGGGDHGSD